MPLLNSLDLFSGIGGFTLALKGIAKPVGYCEIDAGCQQVLKRHIKEGTLPKAPVFSDVRKLSAKDLNKQVDMIVGGWPCQDLSVIGKQRGLSGDRSGLIKEVFRLTDELQPKMLFLENVPMVLHNGIDVIKAEFCKKRGYTMRWAVIPASAVGAPHYRKRWFCLLIKKGYDVTKVKINDADYKPFFAANPKENAVRMVIPKNMAHKNMLGLRTSMLGNSVVPDCVRFAFTTLLHDKTGGENVMPAAWGDAPPQGVAYPRPRLHLVMDPALYRAPVKGPQTCEELKGPTVFRGWSTPRHSSHTSNVITTRTCRDLPTQVRFERKTPDKLRRGVLNPEFVEWMMGYPKGYTVGFRPHTAEA
jgi:hypothetical protein